MDSKPNKARIGKVLQYLDRAASTNDVLRSRMDSGEVKEGTALYTFDQFAGKGQRGKKWESSKGEMLAVSIALYPRFLQANRSFLLNMCICCGARDFLLSSFNLNCRIKWPNDLFFQDSKLAGILIESQILGQNLDSTVVGIGLNINQQKFPTELSRATSVMLETGTRQDAFACIEPLLVCLEKRYSQLVEGDIEQIKDDYLKHMYALNQPRDFRQQEHVFEGTIIGMDDQGRLIISTADGLKTFSHGEFEWIFD